MRGPKNTLMFISALTRLKSGNRLLSTEKQYTRNVVSRPVKLKARYPGDQISRDFASIPFMRSYFLQNSYNRVIIFGIKRVTSQRSDSSGEALT